MPAVPWWFPFGRVPEIDASALAHAVRSDSPPLLLDVRSPNEWQGGHIARAVNVPISRLNAELSGIRLDPDRPIVAICLSGHRSIPAVRLLARRGYRAQQLRGGMLAWRQAGLPTVGVRSTA